MVSEHCDNTTLLTLHPHVNSVLTVSPLSPPCSTDPNDSDPNSKEYYVGRCAQEVMCEYQRQLWDNVDFKAIDKIKKDFHMHVFGEHGIVFLDVRGPRSLHLIKGEQYPYMGSLQWQEVKDALSEEGIMSGRQVPSPHLPCPHRLSPHHHQRPTGPFSHRRRPGPLVFQAVQSRAGDAAQPHSAVEGTEGGEGGDVHWRGRACRGSQ